MKKLLLLLGMALGLLGYLVIASDRVNQEDGTTPYYEKTRYKIRFCGANSPSAVDARLSITNTVATVPSVIGRVVFKPNALSDTITIYDATIASNCVASNIVFIASALSETLLGSTGPGVNSPTLGNPWIFDLAPGWAAANGLMVIMKRGNSSTLLEGWISYDRVR